MSLRLVSRGCTLRCSPECTHPADAAWEAATQVVMNGDIKWWSLCDYCKRRREETLPKGWEEYRLVEPDIPFYFANYFEGLPQCIKDKLAYYLLGQPVLMLNGERKVLHSNLPIKTLAVVQWLSPGYHRNNEEAKRKRMVTEVNVTKENEEESNKEVGRLLSEERETKEKRMRETQGWCSCCGYGGCKRAGDISLKEWRNMLRGYYN